MYQRIMFAVIMVVVGMGCASHVDQPTKIGSEPAETIKFVEPPIKTSPGAQFLTWKTVQLGTHKSVDDLRKALETAGVRIHERASTILENITVASEPTQIGLVRISGEQLGFKRRVTMAEFLTSARLFGFESCPAEVGPQLRLQYKDQPLDEWHRIGMEPILGSDDLETVFNVGHDAVFGELELYAGTAYPDGLWNPGGIWIFCRHR